MSWCCRRHCGPMVHTRQCEPLLAVLEWPRETVKSSATQREPMDSWTVLGGNDTEIRVDATGPEDARRVVFLHGYSQSRLSWRKQFESSLADQYRLVAPDLRGHGRSAKPENAYDDATQWAADLEAVFRSANAEHPAVVAWSYGGLPLLDYLAEHGTDRIAGVNLVAAVSAIGTESATERLGGEYIALMDGLTDTDAERSIEAIEGLVQVCQEESPSEQELALMTGYNALCPPRVRDALRSPPAVTFRRRVCPVPSPSLSLVSVGSFGKASVASGTPSPSVSVLPGSVPLARSSPSGTPSPSVSVTALLERGSRG